MRRDRRAQIIREETMPTHGRFLSCGSRCLSAVLRDSPREASRYTGCQLDIVAISPVASWPAGTGGSDPTTSEERAQLAFGGQATARLHTREARQPARGWTALADSIPPVGGVLLLHGGEEGGGLGLPG